MAITTNDKNLGHATAYAYAKSKGYTGTEEEFAELMASYATVAEEAEASRQAAEVAQGKAEDAQEAAETAQTGAESAKDTAVSAKDTAVSSASTATTKAGEASASATSAASSATAAASSATAAAGSASSAASSATAASGSASTATTKASEAAGSAAAAATAKGAAEEAAANVEASAAQIETNRQNIIALTAEIEKYDDLARIIKITSTTTTLGDIASTLNQVNTAGDHVFFDMSALGVMMYLCTIYIDTSNNVYKVFDLVSGRYAEGAYSPTMLLTMATAQANGLAVQSQIDHLQAEIDELGGKSVLANPEALADLIAAGSSTAMIDPGDKIELNWMASVLGTTTNGLTVTCSDIGAFADAIGEAEAATYLFVYDGSSWTYNGETITLADYGLTVAGTPATGEVMTIVTTVTSTSFDFVDYDGTGVTPSDPNVPHYWLLEQTYAPATKVFDTYESLFCIQAGMTIAAGKYYLPMYSYRSGKTFNVCFELPTAFGGEDKIQFRSGGYDSGAYVDASGASISGVYKPKNMTPIVCGSTTTLGAAIAITTMSTADAVAGGYTDLSTAYAAGTDYVVGNFDTCALGNNTWPWSNLDQHLNDDTKGDNYTPSHDNDIPSAYNRTAGWLYGLDPRVKKHIQPATFKWTAGYGAIGTYVKDTTYDITRKVFLLSMKEMSFNINTSEGEITELYGEYTNNTLDNGAVAERAKYNKAGGTLNSYRWSRSANTGNANNSRGVYSSGSGSFNYSAFSAYYYAPAFIFGKSANQ